MAKPPIEADEFAMAWKDARAERVEEKQKLHFDALISVQNKKAAFPLPASSADDHDRLSRQW